MSVAVCIGLFVQLNIMDKLVVLPIAFMVCWEKQL